MSYINEYKTTLDDAYDCIAKGKDFPHIKLELWEMYFLAAIADELHALNITQKDIRDELKNCDFSAKFVNKTSEMHV